MAERRMFAKTIVLSDAFLDMPISARCLYMTLGMVADDDGFVNAPKSVIRQCGATNDDMNILLAKKFVLDFDSGVIVIKHWRINNYLRSDRYVETKYKEEKAMLGEDENGAYTMLGIPGGIPNTVSTGKDRLGKDSIGKDIYTPTPKPKEPEKHKHGEYGRVLLTDDQYQRLVKDFGEDLIEKQIKYLDEYVQMNDNKLKYKDFNLVLRKSFREGWFVNGQRKPKEKKSIFDGVLDE